MPDQPTPSPDDDEFHELLRARARLLIESIAKDNPAGEVLFDAHDREAFEDGFYLGVLMTLDVLAHRLPHALHLGKHWTNEEAGDLLESEVFLALAALERHEMEASLSRILRVEDGEEEDNVD